MSRSRKRVRPAMTITLSPEQMAQLRDVAERMDVALSRVIEHALSETLPQLAAELDERQEVAA